MKSQILLFPFAALAILAVAMSPVSAAVVVFDGFGDGDLNNNGTPFEVEDVNVAGSLEDDDYIPGRLDVGSGEEPQNPEVTEALDEGDVGIRWLQMRGWTGGSISQGLPGSGDSKPRIRIVDDTAGVMLETQPNSVTGGLGRQAIDSGYAMSWESKGSGSSAAGFFDRTIELGPEVDDEVKVSFDFRLWQDTPNEEAFPPQLSEVRFGLYQDTDDQLGQTNNFAGHQVDAGGNPVSTLQPAVWGQEEGAFEGFLTGLHGATDDVGTNGDNGWQASFFVGNNAPPVLQNGGGSRIREEVQDDRILQGDDVQTIARPQDTTPDDPFNPTFDFINLDPEKVYNIELSLKRATEDTEADTIFATLTVTDPVTQEQWSFGDQEDFSDPLDGGIDSDSWDYFAIRNASGGSNEIDFLLDNFMVEVLGSNAGLPGDFNEDLVVDAADYTTWRNGLGTEFTAADYDTWRSNYGASLGGGGGSISVVPEPATISLGMLLAMLGLVRRRRS